MDQEKLIDMLKSQDIKKLEKLIDDKVDLSSLNLAELIDDINENKEKINLDFFKLLLKNGADVNMQDKNGDTPLLSAIDLMNIALVKLLIENGANTNIANKEEDTALSIAVDIYFETKSFELLDILIKNGADLNFQPEKRMSILTTALLLLNSNILDKIVLEVNLIDKVTKEDIILLIDYLLEKGAKFDTHIGSEHILNVFLLQGNIDAVKILLENDIKPIDFLSEEYHFLYMILTSNKQSLKLYTKDINTDMINFVVKDSDKNKLDIVKLLIKHGVKTDSILQNLINSYLRGKEQKIKDIKLSENLTSEEKTKVILIENNSFNVPLKHIEFLLENGANINIEYKKNDIHPLCSAVKKQDVALVKLLVKYVEDINIYQFNFNDMFMFSMLYDALKKGNFEIITTLVENDIDVNTIDMRTFTTPFTYAIKQNNFKLMELLINNGAKINNIVKDSFDSDKKSLSLLIFEPLVISVTLNNMKITKYLVEHGADINYKIKELDDLSIYEIANEHDDQAIADYLELNGVDISINPDRKEIDFQTIFSLAEYKTTDPEINSSSKKSVKSFNEKINKILKKKNEDLEKILEQRTKQIKEYLNHKKDQPINKLIIEAIESKSIDKLQYLIDEDYVLKDIDINELFADNYPLDFIVAVIKQSNDVNVVSEDGMTPLMFATKASSSEIVKLLLDKGADKTLKTKNNQRAKNFAINNEIRNLIVSYVPQKDNPQKLVKILTNFTIDKPIKYTTHEWDFDLKKEYTDFDGYIQAITDNFDQIKEELENLSPKLYEKIKAFLFETDPNSQYSWCSKANINISWSNLKGLKEHCDSGKKPSDFKLKKPILINKKPVIKKFEDVINLFKQEIEIRSEFKNLSKIFNIQKENLNSNFIFEPSKSKLDKQFYTDTYNFSQAINLMFKEFNKREEFNHIEVITNQNENSYIEITITQNGSTSSQSIDEVLKKIESNGGDMGNIKTLLTNLCDWSIEGIFDDEYYRINLLHSNNVKETEKLSEKPNGFSHILRFYK
ncbi:MAG: ankyrin repeat domain-containing protein [Campylobacterota bacterium]|nr:ankyrin repeat domain-containing protein [Campylobacterota bacterium]